ncbi:MAG: nitrile hydratase subunit beta [Myxococcales bacterium]
MNGIHDMGGMHGLGAIEVERDEPVFHSGWEARTFALTLASGYLGKWNLDMSRFAREQMPAAESLATTYYEHWLFGLRKLLVDQGVLTAQELATGRAESAAPQGLRALKAADVPKALQNRRAARVDQPVAAKFKAGDPVVARNPNPTGHTRLPRYARGRAGVVDRDHGVFIFADAHAMGLGKKPQHVYSVRFEARTLWGPSAPARDAVYLDLWDDHLDPA